MSSYYLIYTIFIIVGILGIIIAAITLILSKLNYNNQNINNQASIGSPTLYQKKSLMTACEMDFYLKIKDLEQYYRIIPQINLASIVTKATNNKYYNDLFRNIDFAIFTPDYSALLLLIELNDNTHNQRNRKIRDLKVQRICNEIGIPLLKFYTNYPNEKNYVLNRIITEIEKTKSSTSNQ